MGPLSTFRNKDSGQSQSLGFLRTKVCTKENACIGRSMF